MARRFPEKYNQSLETLKTLILVRSKLLSEFGRDVTIELSDYQYEPKDDFFYELVFDINIKNVDCADCDFEPEEISNTILHYRDKIEKAAQFHLSPKLQISNGRSTTRGVLLNEIQMKWSEFQTLSYSLFIDPDLAK